MDSKSQEKWDQIYLQSDESADVHAASVVRQHRHWLPKSGSALDFACGRGGNALLFAERGLDTQAMDISAVVLEQLARRSKNTGLALSTKTVDLSNHRLQAVTFDVIACSYYLDRSSFEMLESALKPGGLLFYETYNASLPRGTGPSNPDFLLTDAELLHAFPALQTLFYEELWGVVNTSGKTGLSRIVARKPRRS